MGILKIIWELEFWKLNLRIGFLEIKFERNWSFKNYLKIICRLKFWKFESGNWNFENYLKIGILKINFERNWSFGN